MDKKSTGPYKHYERPTEKRSSQSEQHSGSARWIAVIVILVIILIALIQVVHRLSSNHSEKAEEVQTVKKVSSKKSSKVAKSSKAKKTSSSAAKNSAKTSSTPAKKSKPKTYLVKTGDTLTGIAEKHGMTVDQLARLNNLKDSSNVNVGQTLKLK